MNKMLTQPERLVSLSPVNLVKEVTMNTVNIHEAKTHLSKLVDQAVKGEPFIIAKAGKPLVKVVALTAPDIPQRLGFNSAESLPPEPAVVGIECIATNQRGLISLGTLAIGRRVHDQPVHMLDAPVILHELAGQPVEELRVAGQ